MKIFVVILFVILGLCGNEKTLLSATDFLSLPVAERKKLGKYLGTVERYGNSPAKLINAPQAGYGERVPLSVVKKVKKLPDGRLQLRVDKVVSGKSIARVYTFKRGGQNIDHWAYTKGGNYNGNVYRTLGDNPFPEEIYKDETKAGPKFDASGQLDITNLIKDSTIKFYAKGTYSIPLPDGTSVKAKSVVQEVIPEPGRKRKDNPHYFLIEKRHLLTTEFFYRLTIIPQDPDVGKDKGYLYMYEIPKKGKTFRRHEETIGYLNDKLIIKKDGEIDTSMLIKYALKKFRYDANYVYAITLRDHEGMKKGHVFRAPLKQGCSSYYSGVLPVCYRYMPKQW